MKKREKCKECGARLQIVRISEVKGAAGQAQVRFVDYPVLTCSNGHERWEAYPDFNPGMIDEIFHRRRVPFAKRKGLFRRKQYCSNCEAVLEDSAAVASVKGEVRLKHVLNFVAEVTGPTMTCSRCRHVQLVDSDEHSNDIVNAMVDAFDRHEIKRL